MTVLRVTHHHGGHVVGVSTYVQGEASPRVLKVVSG